MSRRVVRTSRDLVPTGPTNLPTSSRPTTAMRRVISSSRSLRCGDSWSRPLGPTATGDSDERFDNWHGPVDDEVFGVDFAVELPMKIDISKLQDEIVWKSLWKRMFAWQAHGFSKEPCTCSDSFLRKILQVVGSEGASETVRMTSFLGSAITFIFSNLCHPDVLDVFVEC
ncbi:hypothetical protein E4U52_003435 [Claviceps spartinae]|nr:hypothetical protein E4U52_003435 [Claviceps spartinae]